MRSRFSRCGNLFLNTIVFGTVALALGACKTPDVTGSSGALSGSLFSSRSTAPEQVTDWRREAAAAGERYRANPADADVALRFARALRKTDRTMQAVAVLQQASIHHPRDRRLLGDYGRALAETGHLKEAFAMLDRAHTPDQPDWHVLSAQGAVLDQMGQHENARRYYARALAIAPGEASVLSNLGLSYALSKELPKAEETLRQAAQRGSKDRRVTQNLALVVGLQGRFKEAQDIARANLPPEEAAQNVAYLEQMLPQKAAMAAARDKSKTKAAAKSDIAKRGGDPIETGSIKSKPRAPTTAQTEKPKRDTQARSRPLMLTPNG
jgi:Flp pilus assembly protein TadD